MDCFQRHVHSFDNTRIGYLLLVLLFGIDLISSYPSTDAFLLRDFPLASSPRLLLSKRKPASPSPLFHVVGAAASSTEYQDFLPRPNPDLDAHGVVSLCMEALVDGGKDGAGLEVCFTFSNDRCRAALGGSLEKFRQYASNPVFGYLVNCATWETLSIGPIIKGTATRGDMQTVLMAAKAGDDPKTTTSNNSIQRTFLWTLQKERRPPLQGCWIIHEVLYVKNAYAQTL